MTLRMSRVLLVALALAFLAPAAGCIVAPRHHGHRHHRVKHRHRQHRHKRCRPSHYWDGYQCRHKGRGHGARKHDY